MECLKCFSTKLSEARMVCRLLTPAVQATYYFLEFQIMSKLCVHYLSLYLLGVLSYSRVFGGPKFINCNTAGLFSDDSEFLNRRRFFLHIVYSLKMPEFDLHPQNFNISVQFHVEITEFFAHANSTAGSLTCVRIQLIQKRKPFLIGHKDERVGSIK